LQDLRAELDPICFEKAFDTPNRENARFYRNRGSRDVFQLAFIAPAVQMQSENGSERRQSTRLVGRYVS
jgi:hypothetical protein